jgi:hypothetical protein
VEVVEKLIAVIVTEEEILLVMVAVDAVGLTIGRMKIGAHVANVVALGV